MSLCLWIDGFAGTRYSVYSVLSTWYRIRGNTMTPDRRSFLQCAAGCMATGGFYQSLRAAAQAGDAQVFAPTRTHHPAKAQRLIFVFLTGGFSHVDTFDYQPCLLRDQGRITPAVHLRGTDRLPLLGSPFRFARHGK